MIECVGDEHVAAVVHRHSVWIRNSRTRAGLPVAAKTRRAAGPRYRCHDPRARSHPPDAVVPLVGDEHVAACVHCHSRWIAQTCARAVPHHRRDDPRTCINQPDAVILSVGDEQVAAAVHRHCRRTPQTCARGGATVAAEALSAGPRHGRDEPRTRIHAPNAVIAAVGNEEVAAAVKRHSVRIRQTRARGGPVVATTAVPRQRNDNITRYCWRR